jgi:hypothetical protein
MWQAGLADCWDLEANPVREEPEFERLSQAYEKLGCAAPRTCACPAAPAQLACREGNWTSPAAAFFSYACVTGPVPAADGGEKP